ncbi:MAG: hypothetical protein VKK62_09635 [Synechococcaceae cyanobacterium]|nr:hypothetical protein [Synechococcaceae cyanobacterium]
MVDTTFDTALLSPSQRREAWRQLGRVLQSPDWHGDLPVLLLERCWLRLEVVAIDALCSRLPADPSREAPELVRYRELLAQGQPDWLAQQLCWQEFGAEACQQALRVYWQAQEQGRRVWTLETYLALRQDYRRRCEQADPWPLPLLVLARADEARSGARHRLHWLGPRSWEADRTMRHTCP